MSAAALFGTLGYVSRSAAETGLGALSFVAWRALVATAALIAVSIIIGGRRHPRLPDLRALGGRGNLALFAAAMCGALLNILIFAAFLRTSIAVALICFYTFPAIVTIAAARLYGERLSALRLGALALSSIGLALVVLAPLLQSTDVSVDPIGVALALCAAVFQAGFVLIAGRGFAPLPALHVAAYVVAVAVIVSLPLIVLVGEIGSLLTPLDQPDTWFWILAGGLAGAAIPSTAFVAGIGLIGPSRAAILMTVEPLVGVLLAGALLGEQPGALQLLGGAAVLIAAAVLQVAPRAPVPVEAEYPPIV